MGITGRWNAVHSGRLRESAAPARCRGGEEVWGSCFFGSSVLDHDGTGAAGEVHLDEVFTGLVRILLGHESHVGDLAPAAVLPVVTGESDFEGRTFLDRDAEIAMGPAGVEVEGEQQALPGEGDGLAVVVHDVQVAAVLGEHIHTLGQSHHVPVEFAQEAVLQSLIVLQAPLAAAVVEAPAVALPGEVDPFRVAELVAHEVQVCFAATGQSEQADHLM